MCSSPQTFPLRALCELSWSTALLQLNKRRWQLETVSQMCLEAENGKGTASHRLLEVRAQKSSWKNIASATENSHEIAAAFVRLVGRKKSLERVESFHLWITTRLCAENTIQVILISRNSTKEKKKSFMSSSEKHKVTQLYIFWESNSEWVVDTFRALRLTGTKQLKLLQGKHILQPNPPCSSRSEIPDRNTPLCLCLSFYKWC